MTSFANFCLAILILQNLAVFLDCSQPPSLPSSSSSSFFFSSPFSTSSSSSSSSASSSNCPGGCRCSKSSNSVSCQGARLDEIPRGVEQSTTSLDFSRNSLTYVNARTFAFLEKLVQVKLSQNEIESIADGSFSRTPSLQSVDLSSNGLAVLGGYTFKGAEMLLRLDLSDNRLTAVDGAFAGMRELSRLNLCKNRLQAVTRKTFDGLTNLRYLLLCDNSIRRLEAASFSAMEKLVYVVLRNNRLEDVREFQFTSTFLSYVDLSECRLTAVPRGLPNSIRYLQLRRNNLTALDGRTFRDCRFISILVLDDNAIRRVDAGAFDGMVYLRQLWLNGNRLRSFSGSAGLPAGLQKLFVGSNLLAEVPGSAFPADSSLETLSLASNEIETTRRADFANLRSLRKLDLSGNRIGRLGNESFSPLPRLVVLDLSRNPLRTIRRDSFRWTPALEKLFISQVATAAPQIDPDAFRGLENVARLDLEGSPGLILKVAASDRLLSSLPGVRELNLRGSRLTGLRYDFFEFFPKLASLQLSSNRWCCDKTLLWLKAWLTNPPAGVNVSRLEENFCHSPLELRRLSVWKSKFVDYADFTCHVFARDGLGSNGEEEDDDEEEEEEEEETDVEKKKEQTDRHLFSRRDGNRSHSSASSLEFKSRTADSIAYDWDDEEEEEGEEGGKEGGDGGDDLESSSFAVAASTWLPVASRTTTTTATKTGKTTVTIFYPGGGVGGGDGGDGGVSVNHGIPAAPIKSRRTTARASNPTRTVRPPLPQRLPPSPPPRLLPPPPPSPIPPSSTSAVGAWASNERHRARAPAAIARSEARLFSDPHHRNDQRHQDQQDHQDRQQQHHHQRVNEQVPSSETFFVLAVILISIMALVGLLLFVFIVCLVSRSVRVKRAEAGKFHVAPAAAAAAAAAVDDLAARQDGGRPGPGTPSTADSPSDTEHRLLGSEGVPSASLGSYRSRASDARMAEGGSSPSTTGALRRQGGKQCPSGSEATREFMTLIPGRDINHEGPLKVYKWADF